MEKMEKSAVEWLVEQQKELVVQIKNGEFVIEDYEYYNAMYIEQAKAMEDSQATNYAKWSMDIHKLTGRFFTFLEWLKDDPKDHEDYEIIKSISWVKVKKQ
jgi:hypothetical protein